MADLTPPAQMRVMLCAMRSHGWDFDRAWPNAIQRIRVQPYMSQDEATDLIDWKRWLEWAKPAFAAAFDNLPPPDLGPNGNGNKCGDLSADAAAPVVHH